MYRTDRSAAVPQERRKLQNAPLMTLLSASEGPAQAPPPLVAPEKAAPNGRIRRDEPGDGPFVSVPVLPHLCLEQGDGNKGPSLKGIAVGQQCDRRQFGNEHHHILHSTEAISSDSPSISSVLFASVEVLSSSSRVVSILFSSRHF